MTVQKGVIDTNITTIRDDLHGIERGQHLLHLYLASFVEQFRYLTPPYLCVH